MCKSSSDALAPQPVSSSSASRRDRSSATATTTATTTSTSSSTTSSLAAARASLPDPPLLYPFQELAKATNNFLSKRADPGRGSSSSSSSSSSSYWRCSLRARDAALFQLRSRPGIDAAQASAALATIARYHHTSLAPLLGACLAGPHVYLAYELPPGPGAATLAACLRSPRNTSFTVLRTWLSRVQVAADVAQGLEYIHHHAAAVHGRVSPSTVLVSDPGLRARLTHFGAAQFAAAAQEDEDSRGAGEGDELRLLAAWPSPFVHRVRVALHLKGLTGYEYVEEDLANKSDLLLASNPVHKKVPVLIHDGKPVCESMLIVQYLDEAFPGAGPTFLPADPYHRAVARFWAAYVDDNFFASWYKMFGAKTDEERAAAMEATLAALQTLEGAFGECSKGKDFFAGDGPGYMDVALGGLVGWMRANEKVTGVNLLDAGRTPLLAAWADRFAALDAAKAVIPDVDRIVEFAKAMHAQSSAAAPPPANN